jgi:hypothetical protein
MPFRSLNCKTSLTAAKNMSHDMADKDGKVFAAEISRIACQFRFPWKFVHTPSLQQQAPSEVSDRHAMVVRERLHFES